MKQLFVPDVMRNQVFCTNYVFLQKSCFFAQITHIYPKLRELRCFVTPKQNKVIKNEAFVSTVFKNEDVVNEE